MAKIVRKSAKIFGSTAGVNQIAEFGSFAAGSPVYSTDPAVIQSLAQWLSGWFNAVIGANSPAIEDMNAFCYVMAYQIAYIMQAGIAEWDSGTTYYIGSLATSGGSTYRSIADDNLNNAVTDSTKWISAQFTLSTATSNLTVPAGYSWTSSFLTVPDGITYVVAGNAFIGNSVTVSGTGVFTVTGTGQTI